MIALVNANTLRIPLADKSVHMACCSPPYWGLRDYSLGEGGVGLEPTPEAYIANMIAVGREVWRVLRDDGTFWLNLGDSYTSGGRKTRDPGQSKLHPAFTGEHNEVTKWRPDDPPGLKPKDLVGIPWRVALALQADGWWLRSDIIWHKPNPMPESVTDRPTKSHEYVFLLAKRERYFYDAEAVKEQSHTPPGLTWEERKIKGSDKGKNNGVSWRNDVSQAYAGTIGDGHTRNRRSVWTIATQPYSGAHFATFPEALVEPMIKAGTSERGCCPECGAQWERMTEKESPPIEVFTRTSVKNDIGDYLYTPRKDGVKVGAGQKYQNWRNEHPAITTGFHPTCSHDADPVPAIVLDPFAGSGTTGVVARRLGRHFIGLDLSFDYLANQAITRLELDRLQAWQDGQAEPVTDDMADLPLFRNTTWPE